MRLALVGATGRTGSRVLEFALARGHSVRALTRRPPQGVSDPRVEWIEGSVLDPSAVARMASGTDAVLVALGPSDDDPPDVCSRGTATVISACRAFRISRLVVLTGAMIGHPRDRLAMLLRTMWRTYSVVRPAGAADREAQERLVTESNLDWTLVRPPRIVDGDPTEGARAGSQLFVGARAQATTADVALVMLDAVEQGEWSRDGVTVISDAEAEAEPDLSENPFGTGPLPAPTNEPIPVEVEWDLDDDAWEPLGDDEEIPEEAADAGPPVSLADRRTPGVDTDSVDLLEVISGGDPDPDPEQSER